MMVMTATGRLFSEVSTENLLLDTDKVELYCTIYRYQHSTCNCGQNLMQTTTNLTNLSLVLGLRCLISSNGGSVNNRPLFLDVKWIVKNDRVKGIVLKDESMA